VNFAAYAREFPAKLVKGLAIVLLAAVASTTFAESPRRVPSELADEIEAVVEENVLKTFEVLQQGKQDVPAFERAISKMLVYIRQGSVTNKSPQVLMSELYGFCNPTDNPLGSAKARKGDFEGATADYNQAIRLDPKDFAAFERRALTKQLKGDFEGALGDLVLFDELAPPGGSQDYAHLYTWLVRVRRGQSAEANRELAAYLGSRRNTPAADWIPKIGRFLLDQISESDFLGDATSSDVEKDRAQHCEAWYYAGMKRLLAGDKKTAADYFNKCLGTQERNFDEYILAQKRRALRGTVGSRTGRERQACLARPWKLRRAGSYRPGGFQSEI
jgi:tetratricopeptide (TPR) repeat protein